MKDTISNSEALDSARLRLVIFKEIIAERDHQDRKFGSQRKQPATVWLSVLAEELGEVAGELNDTLWVGSLRLEKELIQVAAVAVCWLEAIRACRDNL